jgi:hypothetical protein
VAGFDIYGPTDDICKHMYTRQESSKFWETVNSLYNFPGMHYELTVLVRRIYLIK